MNGFKAGAAIAILCYCINSSHAAPILPTHSEPTLDIDTMLENSPRQTADLLFLGDMAFDKEMLRSNGFKADRWPNGVLPIEFDSAIATKNQEKFYKACAEWSAVASIECIPHDNQAGRIKVVSGTGNWSFVGKQGDIQVLQIEDWQWESTLVHLIGHALGFAHQHQRPDRDSFVEIIESNVEQGDEWSFKIIPMSSEDLPSYDFVSIMSYRADTHGRKDANTGIARKTIRPISEYSDLASNMGRLEGVSELDAIATQAAYGGRTRIVGASNDIIKSKPGKPSHSSHRSAGESPEIYIETYSKYQENMNKMTTELGLPKVRGGESVDHPAFSDVVGLAAENSEVVLCTGTLVASDRVVTARHCACKGYVGRVMVGSSKENAEWFEVEKVRSIEDRDLCDPEMSIDNPDIVVLHLSVPIQHVTPRAIATSEEIDSAQAYTVVGFGFNDNLRSGIKHEADVPSATNSCTNTIPEHNTSESELFGCIVGKEIVAGQSGLGRDTCKGDSGGPLFYFPPDSLSEEDLKLAGVTSRSTKNSAVFCGDGGIYVKISEDVRKFIFG